jgi:Family of unknown function (DUF6174)/Carboxypeptidase regulatory-like domain
MLESRRVWPSIGLVATTVLGPQSAAAQAEARAAANAQPAGGVVAGVVIDRLTGLHLREVTVLLLGRATSPRTDTTNYSGSFRFDSVPAGEYVVAVEHRLLDSAWKTFRAAQGDSIHLTLAARGRTAPPVWTSERLAAIAAFDSARARWSRARPAAYRFTVRVECFCLPANPVRFDVRGREISMVDVNGAPRPVPEGIKAKDIDGLLDEVANVVREYWVSPPVIVYDRAFGYPLGFALHRGGPTDAELRIYIDRFEPLTERRR